MILAKGIIGTNSRSSLEVFSVKKKIYTYLNPVSYLDALKHKELFMQFDGIFADGGLLVKAIKVLYGKSVKRKSFDMTSMAPLLFEYAVREGKSVAIIATKQDLLERAVNIFRERYPGLDIAYFRNGYFANEEEKDEEARNIMAINPDFLIVGMGIVVQEDFLLRVKQAGYQGIGFTCGGFIHQTAQNMADYYPKWVDDYGLRFLYRMYKEPHTRKRYAKAAFVFPIRFLMEKFSSNETQ